MRTARKELPRRTKADLDNYTRLLKDVREEGKVGRVRFCSSKGYGFLRALGTGGQEGGDFFFHARVLVAVDQAPHWEVFGRLMDSGGGADSDWEEGPVVRFLPASPPGPKGPSCTVVWVLEAGDLQKAQEEIYG